MITIKPSPTADSRTCDVSQVSQQQLLNSSVQHIADVSRALQFFQNVLAEEATVHDYDKLTDIEGFYRDFKVKFATTDWWDAHRKLNRHHLANEDGIPVDVNLCDVIAYICDCVMAGMARSGSVYPLSLPPELLERAFQNTVTLLKENVRVE